MTQRTVAANELAIKALRCPHDKARVVYHVDGHGNEGLKLYVESSGTKTFWNCTNGYVPMEFLSLKSPRNSEPGRNPLTSTRSRACVQAT